MEVDPADDDAAHLSALTPPIRRICIAALLRNPTARKGLVVALWLGIATACAAAVWGDGEERGEIASGLSPCLP